MRKDQLRYLGVLVLLIYGSNQANAGLTLTAAGTTQGFTLSTFASGFPTIDSGVPGFGFGPFGIGFPGGGAVLVLDAFGDMRRFPTDTDGQNAGLVPVTYNYGNPNPGDIGASGGKLYITLNANSSPDPSIVQINADGTFNQTIASLNFPAGIATNPMNGHLFVSIEDFTHFQIVDIDPITKTVTPFVDAPAPDGVVFNASGSILYVARDDDQGRVLGFDTVTKAQVFDSGIISGGPDGVTLGTGVLAGNLFVNTNDGRVVEINLATHAQTEIANGGSRGDFVKVDPYNGSLLLIQSDSILRLTPPTGGGFDGGPVPEPSSFTIFGLLALGLLGWRRL
jgi:DNA-binding beta-propeller fold protein YncE